MEKEHLKLVVLYDANRNEYSILRHNESAEEAQELAAKWNPQLVAGCSLIVLDQPGRHRSLDPQECRTCRKIVVRSANLSPRPKFTRRKES